MERGRERAGLSEQHQPERCQGGGLAASSGGVCVPATQQVALSRQCPLPNIMVPGAHSGQCRQAGTAHNNQSNDFKKGTAGKPINLRANYFELSKMQWCLMEYHVNFVPDDGILSNKLNYLKVASKDINLSGYLFDGTVLTTPNLIQIDRLEIYVGNILPGAEMVKVILIRIGEVDRDDFRYIQIFNSILKKCINHLNLDRVKNNYFDPQAVTILNAYILCILPGYKLSIRQYESKILLCCDIISKVHRLDSVHDLFLECSRNARGCTKKVFLDGIVGSIVLTVYNNRTYRIDDVDFNSSPQSTFRKSDGSIVSYVDYFKERYGITIKSMEQPLLISMSKCYEMLVLIPELCKVTGLTDQQRTNFQLMNELKNHTKLGALDTLSRVHIFARRVMNCREAMENLKAWNFDLNQQVIKFSGRVLPNPQIVGGNKREFDAGEGDWIKALQDINMYADPPLKSWCIIYPSKFLLGLSVFIENLKKASQGLNWRLGKPEFHELTDDSVRFYMDTIDSVTRNIEMKLLLIVVPHQRNSLYAAIKKKCCVVKGIPSQVIVARNLDGRSGLTVATNIAIQLCCKIGGAPWTVNISIDHMMVVGYDSCQDSQYQSKTIGAVVCSLDNQLTRYFSQASSHSNEEELINFFSISLMKGVQEYYKVNGVCPEKFLIYRNSEDEQNPNDFLEEVNKLKDYLNNMYGNELLQMAFIVVSKRINTRLFGETDNPPPGTVVDDVITMPERHEFLLVSNYTNVGTVSPTSYKVIYNNLELDADELQQITYKMTHLYYNKLRNICKPAPCQYAHKLASLTARVLHCPAHPRLNTSLFYL